MAVVGPGLTVLQFTDGVGCLTALVVGLLGGILAGMALARARLSPEEDGPPNQLSWAPPPVESGDTVEPAFDALDDETALTDEERVVKLLSANGGRMKQSRIVEETDWSKAKVSRLLSSMADHDQITKLTIGRENIIFLGAADDVYLSGNESER
ncbi:MAG: helix-turn-helix domain-containing protein [Halalkalicoccus sp.]